MTEQSVVRVPYNYHFNSHIDRYPDLAFLDPPTLFSEVGLPDNRFVFCTFCDLGRICRRMFAAVMRILKRVENGIWWLCGDASSLLVVLRFRQEAEKHGIRPDRLVFANRIFCKSSHLRRLGHAHLMLDTFKYNGHTNVYDHVWVGVPFVSLVGQTIASRVCASVASVLDIPTMAVKS